MSNSFLTPWTVALQAPLPMGFSRQEYWNGLPFPSPGDLPNPGTEPLLHHLHWPVDSLLLRHQGSPIYACIIYIYTYIPIYIYIYSTMYLSIFSVIYLFFLRFFSLINCYKILSIVPSADYSILKRSCTIQIFLQQTIWYTKVVPCST